MDGLQGGIHSKFHPIALILNHTLHFLLRCHHFLDCSAPVSKSLEPHVHNSNDSCNLCLKTVLSCLTVPQHISKLSILFMLILYCVTFQRIQILLKCCVKFYSSFFHLQYNRHTIQEFGFHVFPWVTTTM